MNCPECKNAVQPGTKICQSCQNDLSVLTAEVVETPNRENPYASRVELQQATMGRQESEGDATGGVIPYKNPKALIAYYLGIVSGLPLIGFPFGVAAFVLGVMGLRARKANPAIKGSVHAWIGIGCGGLFMLLWGLVALAMIIPLLTA